MPTSSGAQRLKRYSSAERGAVADHSDVERRSIRSCRFSQATCSMVKLWLGSRESTSPPPLSHPSTVAREPSATARVITGSDALAAYSSASATHPRSIWAEVFPANAGPQKAIQKAAGKRMGPSHGGKVTSLLDSGAGFPTELTPLPLSLSTSASRPENIPRRATQGRRLDPRSQRKTHSKSAMRVEMLMGETARGGEACMSQIPSSGGRGVFRSLLPSTL